MRVLAVGLLAVGIGGFAWVLVTWRWQDPVTYLYTRSQQEGLAKAYNRAEAAYGARAQRAGASSLEGVRIAAVRYGRTLRRGNPAGRLRVSRIGLDAIVVEGTDEASLRRGPGRDRRSLMPGGGGLVYVAGHRTTFMAPFAHIDLLRRGDRIVFAVPYATITYRVTGHRIVKATDMSALEPRPHEVLVLQACHPRFFARERYLVYATPIELVPRGGATIRLPEAR